MLTHPLLTGGFSCPRFPSALLLFPFLSRCHLVSFLHIFTIFNLSQKHTGKDGALVLKKTKMRASLTPKFIPERKAIFARLINPLGFTVLKYNQDEIRE